MPDPTESSPLRVAVIGAWHVHAGDYARQTVAHPETELIAVWDDDPDRGAALAEQHGVEFGQRPAPPCWPATISTP